MTHTPCPCPECTTRRETPGASWVTHHRVWPESTLREQVSRACTDDLRRCIPAQPEDTDLVLSDVLHELLRLRGEVETMRSQGSSALVELDALRTELAAEKAARADLAVEARETGARTETCRWCDDTGKIMTVSEGEVECGCDLGTGAPPTPASGCTCVFGEGDSPTCQVHAPGDWGGPPTPAAQCDHLRADWKAIDGKLLCSRCGWDANAYKREAKP